MPKKKNSKAQKITNKIARYLDKTGVNYRLFQHKVVYTAHDAAQTTKKKLNEIAKVVLVKLDNSFCLVVLPAGKYVDLKGVKKALKAKKVSLATEKDFVKALKTKIGLLHPFGNVYKIPTLLDKGLARAKKLVASAGSYTESLEMAVKDFEKLTQPARGRFSKSKK